MDDFGTKVDDSSGPDGEFTAAEANNELGELMNAVEKSGQTLSGGSDIQLSKAMVNHVASSDFYTGTGLNSYTLSPIVTGGVNFTGPTLYIDGMIVRTFIGTANTGNVTVDVNSIGAKSVFNKDSEITSGVFEGNCEIVYSLSDDRFNLMNSGTDGTNTGAVSSVTAGTNLNKTGTASDPILNLNSAVTGTSVNGVTLSTAQGTSNFLRGDGAYAAIPDTSSTLSVTTTEVTATGASNYVVATDITVLRIICVGGGGGGGGSNATSINAFGGGGGGGSGGYCEDTIIVNDTQTYNLVVGTGGAGASLSDGADGTLSSVTLSGGSQKLLSNGGEGGRLAGGTTAAGIISGGVGGTSTVENGISNVLTGGSGEPGISLDTGNRTISGNGGSNGVGAGGLGVFIGTSTTGNNGGLGAGASGGKAEGTGGVAAGGNGGDGVIIIIAYKAT